MHIQLIRPVLLLSVFCVVFAFGLEARPGDPVFLLRRPGLLLRSLLALNVVMVAFAIAVSEIFKLDPEVQVAILVLAVSPVPPILPKNSVKANGDIAYGIGLLCAAVLASIVIVPVSIDLLGRYFGVNAYMPPMKIVPIVLLTALLPMLGGIAVHKFAPGIASRIAKPLGRWAGILMLLVLLPVLFFKAGQMWSMVGNGVLLVLIGFSVVGLAVGHLLGGPDPDDRTVLALATCMRHPAIAFAIVTLNFPHLKSAVLAVILWHLLIGLVVTIPYKAWRKRVHQAA
jgi:bile acid:Na+ symporter, BASS family